MVVEQVMAVHAGGTTDARLAPTPGPNLFYQIGTYLYQLAIRLCHQITQGAKELWGSGSQYSSMRYRTDAAMLAMPHGWPMVLDMRVKRTYSNQAHALDGLQYF